MKNLTYLMLIAMALTFFLTLGAQSAADDGGGDGGECEILRQVPRAICLTAEDGGPAEESSE